LIQNFGRYVLTGPEEEILEDFYHKLGAKWISSMVQTEHITQHPLSHPTDQAKQLRQHALERLTIFLAEARRQQSDYKIEWLKDGANFTVKEVRDLKAKYTLRLGRQEHTHYEVSA
jgi:ABC-type glutathione transport system ATPase component